MPLAHHHHHHPSPSFLSSLGSMFHTRPQQTASTNLPVSLTSDHVHTYEDFEANLTQRLNLLLPPEGAFFLSLPSIRQAMGVLLATESDLQAVHPECHTPLTSTQLRMVNDFFDKSVKLMDVCNAIREAILEVQRWEVLLNVVIRSLSGNLIEAQLRRAIRTLAELMLAMDLEKDEETSHLQLHRSFKWAHRHSNVCRELPRWKSWNGNSTSNPSRQIQAVGLSLSAPKHSDVDTEEATAAAIYALHVIGVFFLSTIMAALTSQSKNFIVSFTHSRPFLWSGPLLSLQEKALEEIRKRGKKGNNGFLWELYQIASYVKQLYKNTDKVLLSKTFPLAEDQQVEFRRLVKQLSQYVQELERDLGHLDEQISDFFHRLIQNRIVLLDLLSQGDT